MNNVKEFSWNDPTTKSYATRENAVKAIEKLVAHRDDQFHVIVTTNDEGRFVPVVLLTEPQIHSMMYFARKSIPVVRV